MKTSIRKLLSWYDKNRRILPWREDPSPYHVWISEIMLQQTRVEAVKPYYERFLEALPDVAALAAVPEDALMKLWQGLGYYSRARNLKRAAQIVLVEYGGELPSDPESLEKLPGIGCYTAGAVASIAYGRCCPAVDGNALRIYTRMHADPDDIGKEQTKRRIRDAIAAVLPREPFAAGRVNQALMDLGATVCLPTGLPKCAECPWKSLCQAHLRRCETEFPRSAPKKARRIEERTILLIEDADRILIRRRPDRGLLAGLYELPGLEGHRTENEVLTWCRAQGIEPIRMTPLPPAKHVFTHIEWHMTGMRIRVDGFENLFPETIGGILVNKEEIATRYSIPSAFSNYILYIM